MTQKKNPHLKLVKPLDLGEIKQKARIYRKKKVRRYMANAFIAFMVLFGTYLLLTNHSYDAIYRSTSYKKETSDGNRYVTFQDGIVRYSRDGIAFLNHKNEELWIQPGQFKKPVFVSKEHTFAVGDVGGNSIQVFTENGLKGEIETTLPIERVAISDQGVVSVILKNENSPVIVTYDAVGNILVEMQITVNDIGYPTALDMSDDGTVLAVSYIYTEGTTLKSKVAFYNFSDAGKEKPDHQVSLEEYENSIMPEVFFMNSSTSVVAGDHSFVIYEGKETPAKKREVEIGQEIRSVFHTEKYIGFVLLNAEKTGYEVRLYNKAGRQIMNRAFSGEYSNVQMIGNEIFMFEGSKCCIITKTGLVRFKGDMRTEVLAMIPLTGINRYLVMSANDVRVIYLTK